MCRRLRILPGVCVNRSSIRGVKSVPQVMNLNQRREMFLVWAMRMIGVTLGCMICRHAHVRSRRILMKVVMHQLKRGQDTILSGVVIAQPEMSRK